MHIMEGFLPAEHAAAWTVIATPFVAHGIYKLNKLIKIHPEKRMLLGASAAFAFVLSALKLPSVTGSSSHATGTGCGAILFGPTMMAPAGTVVLLFQALLMAHGGLTTLGANVFSMAVAGPALSWMVYRFFIRLNVMLDFSIFISAALGNIVTYLVTSLQLALAFPDETGGITNSFIKFAGIFAITQIPLSLVEGILTVLFFRVLRKYDHVPSDI